MMKRMEPINLLLIEDEEYDVRRVRNTLKPFADRIRIRDIVSDGREAMDLIEKDGGKYDVVIMDFQIAGALIGENLIRRIKSVDPSLQIIVVTKMTVNVSDFDFAQKLLEAGAMWYCTKYPGDIDAFIYQPTDFVLNIINAYEKKKLLLEQQSSTNKLQKSIQDLLQRKRIIGESPVVQRMRENIVQFANTNAHVILLGPSGTGKEVVAANIHYNSKRRFENYVPINCGSLPDHLIESELFGFEKGAFTGASTGKKGLFEIADGGTIFLDEITELPISVQSKLLRVIQEGELDKIGRTGKVQVDVRVIAATNKDLQAEVREKRFREDLYYRLNVVSITVPALKQRREDISLFIEHFLKLFSAEMNHEPPEIVPEAWPVLIDYEWPGNVREVQNVVQRMLVARTKLITLGHVKAALGLQEDVSMHSNAPAWAVWSKDRIIQWHDMERLVQDKYFRFVRDNTESDAEAARLLGLAPPNYHRMCKRLGIK